MNTRSCLKLIVPLISAAVLCSCKSTSVTSARYDPQAHLPPNAKLFLAIPADGQYSGREYVGSGQAVTATFEQALAAHTPHIIIGPTQADPEAVVAKARETNCAFAVLPRITRWEDRATEWSGKRDKMEIAVRVIDTANGKTLRAATITGKSSWFTFGGDHPQDLLREPIDEFVRSLFH
jgi:hypothetical protein